MKNQKGFTLIELLVVIAIIGLLSSLAVIALSGASKKADDAKVKSDLSQLRTWVTVNYPDVTDFTTIGLTSTTNTGLVPKTGVTYTVTNNASGWCASAPLTGGSDAAKFFCVDSKGSSIVTSTACSSGNPCQ